MKYLGLIVITTLFFFSCKNKNKDIVKYSESNTNLIDSLEKKYSQKSYTFNESNFVYSTVDKSLVIDTLQIMQKLYIDSIIINDKNEHVYQVTYIDIDKIKKGFVSSDDISQQYLNSLEDSTVLFLLSIKQFSDSTNAAILKAVYNNQVLDELVLDSFVLGYDMTIEFADSIDLANTKEILCVNIYYPACGYGNYYHYIDFNEKFIKITSQSSFVDAPYYSSFTSYFLLKGTKKLTRFYGRKPYIDKKDKESFYSIPDEYKLIPLNELFYVTYSANEDSIANGSIVYDKNDGPILKDKVYKNVLFRWKNNKADTVFIFKDEFLDN